MLSILMLVVYVGCTIGLFIQSRRLRAGWIAAKFKDKPAEFLSRKHKEFKQCFVMFAITSPAWLIMGLMSLPNANAIERFVLAGIGAIGAAIIFALKSRLPAKIGA